VTDHKGGNTFRCTVPHFETAKANGLEPSRYLRYLFEKYPYAKTSEDIFNLLPMNVSKEELKK